MKLTPLGFHIHSGQVEVGAPLLYRIYIRHKATGALTTIYVGQTKNGSDRPFKRYDLNIRRLLQGKPPLNGRSYRPVHYDLFAAHRAGHQVVIELVRNVDMSREQITDAEQDLQRHYGLEKRFDRIEERQLMDNGEPVLKGTL